jgi:hypothetical protein
MGFLSLVRAQLIAALLVCPYVCLSGGNLFASDDAQGASCRCCGGSQNHDGPAAPCDEGQSSDCLCRGAVADPGQPSQANCDFPSAPAVGFELPTLARHQSQIARAAALFLERAEPPAAGRRLRARIASLLI